MLYCEKCHVVFEEGRQSCPNCKNKKSVRAVQNEDMVYLNSADEYTMGLLTPLLDEAGITYKLEKFGEGWVSYMYDSEVMPTDKTISVLYEDYEQAQEMVAKVRKQVEAERAGDTEDFEEMPPRRRLIAQIVSVILFLIAIVVVVLGADWVANTVKGFFMK